MKLLSRDPADRYESTAELVEDLKRARDGMPPVSSSAGKTPSDTFTDAPTLALSPTASGSATDGTAGMPRRRTFWLPIFFAVLVGALAIVGWSLLRAAGPASVIGTPGGNAGGPPAGAERARGGHQEVKVPAVKGLGKQAARGRLDEAGFRVAVRFQGSSQEDTDRVLEQSVDGGKQAREGSKIVLTVGGGPRVAEVPDLVGLTYSEAEGKLEQAGLLLGGVQEVPSETVPAGIIAGQDPQAGLPYEQHRATYGDDRRILNPSALLKLRRAQGHSKPSRVPSKW